MRKKPYGRPRLTTFGSIEDLTKGPSFGWIDVLVGVVGIGDGDGGYEKECKFIYSQEHCSPGS